jgi:hypothetical protein
MPSFSHILFGFVLVLPVLLLARDRMNYKALLIFILNNYFGPDGTYAFIFLPLNGHTLVGFAVYALIFAFMYSYFSKFSISRDGWRFSIHDDGKIEVPYKQAYMLCLAGGICHFTIDMIGHKGFKTYFFQWYDLNLSAFHHLELWGVDYYHNIGALAAVGYIYIMLVILLLFQVIQKEPKTQYKFAGGIILTTIVLMLVSRGLFFAETEITTPLVILVYFLLPFTLLYGALQQLYEMKTKGIEIPAKEVEPKLILKLIIGLLTILCLTLLIAGIIVNGMATEIGTQFGYDPALFFVGSIAAMILSGILALITISLALRKEFARKLIVTIGIMGYAIVIPLLLAFALSETKVKELFIKGKIE